MRIEVSRRYGGLTFEVDSVLTIEQAMSALVRAGLVPEGAAVGHVKTYYSGPERWRWLLSWHIPLATVHDVPEQAWVTVDDSIGIRPDGPTVKIPFPGLEDGAHHIEYVPDPDESINERSISIDHLERE